MSQLTPQDYYAASRQRSTEAFHLIKEGHFGFSIYTSGLAAECMLRAYMSLDGASFSSSHDLQGFLRLSKLTSVHAAPIRVRLLACVTDIYQVWDNVYRFYPDEKLLRMYKGAGSDRKIQGDAMKFISKRFYDSCYELVKIGVAKWPH